MPWADPRGVHQVPGDPPLLLPNVFITSELVKLHVLATQSFGPRSLCPLCSETEVAGRTLQKMLSEFTGPTSPVSVLTARFGPIWTVVAQVLRIDGINIASTTGNNVGTSSSFKEFFFITRITPGLPTSLVRIAVERSFLEASKADYASSV